MVVQGRAGLEEAPSLLAVDWARSRSGWRRFAAGVMTVVAGGAATGCGASSSATSTVVARVGDLEIINPFLPGPSSPSVASVYLTVRDTGSVADELVSVSSPVAGSSSLMTERPNGTMGTLHGLVVPAHGEASLAPGADHAMLVRPPTLRVGQKVPVTLRFAQAGTLTVSVPVVPLDQILGHRGGGTGGGSGGMSNMPGM